MALMFTFAVGTSVTSMAQEKAKHRDVRIKRSAKATDKDAIVIKIVDGKIFLDGKEIGEIDDADRPLKVIREGDGDEEIIMLKGMRDHAGFAFFSDDDARHEFEISLEHMGDAHKSFEVLRKMKEGQMAHMEARLAPMRGRAFRFSTGNGGGNLFFTSELDMHFGGESMRMEMKSKELAMKIRHEEGDTSELEAQLDELLSDIFEAKQESMQNRIDKLRHQLGDLEQKLTDRNGDTSEILARRKNELLGKSSKYDW